MMSQRRKSHGGAKRIGAKGALVVALVGALMFGAGSPASAQMRPSAPVPGTESGSAQLMVRIDQLEAQLRALTGNIEQYEFRIRQLEERLRRFQEDAEFRFQELGAGGGDAERQPGAPTSRPPSPLPQPLPENFGGMKPLAPPSSNVPAGAAPLNINPAARPGATAPFPLGGGNSADVALAVPDDPRTAYDVAYAFILQRDFEAAEDAFADFLRRYPDDQLAPNAQYWLGESHYAQGRYREAADAFLNGYRRFKSSSKGPDSLVKLAMSLQALGEKEAACASYAEFARQYPKASAALKNRVRAEQKSARC